jgi:transketolase
MTQHQDDWRELGQQLRVDSIRSSSAANSGHPTSSMSAADLMAVLMSKYLHYDFDRPDDPRNDHLIFSKGHASPLLYAMYKAAGAISDDEMLTFREFGSRIEGHPTPVLPWVDVATGSLGQGLPISVGIALAGKRMDRLPIRVWCLCGDSEMAEGSMWEAFEAASHHELDNLVAIIDVNRLGQTGPTMHGWDLDAYRRRAEAFGWHAIEVDGHDIAAIDRAFAEAVETTGRPTVIIARTEKGHGVKAVADLPGKHGKPVEDADAAIEELGGMRNIRVDVPKPAFDGEPHVFPTEPLSLPVYEPGTKEATRKAFGDALVALGRANGKVAAVDGEVGNSTYTEDFAKAIPERFVQAYIAEQQMVSIAVGMQVRGWKPYAATFAAFLARAYDFVRMAAISRANLNIGGSHAGVSIGEDGASQMALEDLAAFRAVHGSTVLYPSDANQAAALIPQMAEREGIVFMRTTREKTPIIYEPSETFEIGGARVVRGSDGDALTIVGAGITLHEAIKAADSLAGEGISARVIDLYSVKPIDAETLRAAARETGAILTVEDHWPEGGLGDAVLGALAEEQPHPIVVKLAVRDMPGSGKPAEMLHAAGIDADCIVAAARDLVARTSSTADASGTGSGRSGSPEEMTT